MASHHETIHLEHLPASHTIHLALYRNIKNASFLQQQLLAGNTSFEYALIDASVIVSRTHALAAAYRAINDLISGRLRSRNVHSEIVFSLSPNNNIAESFRRFGITPTTTHLLIIKVSTPASPFTFSDFESHLSAEFEGDPTPFTDAEIEKISDIPRIKKIYKLNSGGGGGGGKKKVVNGGDGGDGINGVLGKEEDVERRGLEISILGAMALRGATN